MKVQVDGDVVVFRAGFGAEHAEYDVTYTDDTFGEEVLMTCRYKKDADDLVKQLEKLGHKPEVEKRRVVEPLSHALHNVSSILHNILDTVNAGKDDTTVWFSCPSEENFRMDIGTIKPYKGNRDKAWRPTYEQDIKEYIIKNWNGKYAVGEEADDAMGIAQMALPYGESVIVTNDKDLAMIPGYHYNFVKKERYQVDEDTAAWLFWQQVIKGDPTDNIPGVPKIGDAKAEKAMADAWEEGKFDENKAYEIARALYVQGYGDEEADEALVENARLVWIRRESDEMWNPPTQQENT